MIFIDQRDRRPIYEQIVDKLSDLMARAILKQDDPLPSVRTLATELSINPNTVQRAYIELERQGYIYSVKGRGSFVSDMQKIQAGKREAIFLELFELVRRAKTAGIRENEFVSYSQKLYEDAAHHGTRTDSAAAADMAGGKQ
ncbi:GntR family transcriptional regulator [Fusobacterium naviforme]|uniref:GntR family transcriptional regulator n=1 Tax=Moryella indoligenes TaxID=371674 RepID=A0AAE3V9W1_9FIRM|nr:GntR family transcriptional regulator [Moryella indoligenes]KAB0576467.1 GntR family transcriptional regulator [Fusobacterium naviforme]MDQ0152459.1 GntR family transcriptional regulator [Moryella indoligenes]PSL09490.1 GntR family transcriptional regulator [Fusobacterium naviforme]STO27017.1 HTH-type transcriptional repressor yvoA [Fusobacterium naviforme]